MGPRTRAPFDFFKQTEVTNDEADYGRYGAGIGEFNVQDIRFSGHGGFWGISMYYLLEHDVSIVLAVNQVESDEEFWLNAVVQALQSARLFP